MICRARARASRSRGSSGACAGGGHFSSRYSTMALDSDSEKAPSISAGTRAVNDVST